MTLSLRRCILTLALASACVDDSDDGKASSLTVVVPSTDGAVVVRVGDAGAELLGDSGVVISGGAATQLELNCRKFVVTESTLAGFTVQARDAEGRPAAAGTFVGIKPSAGAIVADQAAGGLTDARGVVQFSYLAPHFDYPMPISVEAALLDAQGRPSQTVRCNFQVVVDAMEFVTPASGSTVGWKASAPVTLKVAAEDIPSKCDEGGGVRLLSIGSSVGGFARTADDPASSTLCLDTLGGGAMTQFHVRGGDRGGSFRFEARALAYRTEFTLNLVGAPAGVTLKGDTSDINVNSAANIVVSVVDDAGQGVGDVPVTVNISRCAGLSCSAAETVTPKQVTTRADGTAMVAYFAGDSAGAAQITATLTDRPSISGTIVLRVH